MTRQKGVKQKEVTSNVNNAQLDVSRSIATQSPVSAPIGRLLVNRINIWKTLPNSKFANDIISRGLTIPFINKQASLRLMKDKGQVRQYDNNKRRSLDKECDRLLELGVIETLPRDAYIYFNHVFFNVKPNGTIRLIFDMKELNKNIAKPRFKMLKSSTIFPYLLNNNFACKLDLKDAYWHIPLHSMAQKFLTFKLGNRKFKWTVMPFVLKTAPYIFTKIMFTVVKYIQKKYGIIVFNYLDDFIILAQDYWTCKEHTKIVIKVLSELGWKISLEKSVTDPVKEIDFLGVTYYLDSKTMHPMTKNVKKCKDITKTFTNLTKANLTLFQKLLGTYNFVSNFTLFGRNYIKCLHRFYGYFKSGSKIIPPSLKMQIQKWKTKEMFNKVNIPKQTYDYEIFSDASNEGWGGVLYKDRNIDYVKGTWNQSENEMHINLKELLACMKTIQYFIEKVRKCNLMLNVDSKVTVAWINKRGSIKNPVANELILDLMKVSHKFEIHFIASWIKGSNNGKFKWTVRPFVLKTAPVIR